MSLVRISALPHLYGIPEETARRWLSEGKLTRHGGRLTKDGRRVKPWLVDTDEVEQQGRQHIRVFETRHAEQYAQVR